MVGVQGVFLVEPNTEKNGKTQEILSFYKKLLGDSSRFLKET